MGRRRTIDRDQLLDAAEAVIAREGAAGLTIDAVAKEMGITKGGVQYCFGTKDALIDAIFERWGKAYDSLFEAVAGKQPTPLTRVRAHAEATQRSDELSSSKAAALMAALIQTPEHLEGSNQWYRSRLEGLDLSAPEGRRARLAFLAVEGAFMLRYFRLMDIGQEEWDSMLDDVRALLLTRAGARGYCGSAGARCGWSPQSKAKCSLFRSMIEPVGFAIAAAWPLARGSRRAK